MVGTDANLLKTFLWQLINPAPFPSAVPGLPDPRIAAASLGDTLAEGHQEVQAGHHVAADVVEEDWALFEIVFNDWIHNYRNPSASWDNWVLSRTKPSDLDNYRYVHSLFQYLQWQQGGRRNRRWLMKNCGHLAHLEELLTVFPKATLVHIHRDPNICIPSNAKVLCNFAGLRVSNLDPKFIGEFVLRWEKHVIDKYLEARDHLGLNGRIFDVQYDQIRSDPMPTIREMYSRAGHTLTPEAEQGMLQWEKVNEQGKHGKHVYSLEQFGLSEQSINDAFGEYIHRFIDH